METISNLKAVNFLSLRDVDVKFTGLDVLVGPNGVGKTNLLKALEFLGLVARLDLSQAIDSMGGIQNLKFRSGNPRQGAVSIEVEGNITTHASQRAPDRYKLEFDVFPVRLRVNHKDSTSREARSILRREEEIALKRTPGRGRRITLRGSDVHFDWVGSSPRKSPGPIKLQESATGLATLRRLGEEYDASQVEALAQVFETLRLFEINVDLARQACPADERRPRLDSSASNLAHFLNWMRVSHKDEFALLCEDVRFVLPSFREFVFEEVGGAEISVSVSVKEHNLSDHTPLSRVSYGTIRAIALFAMLHDPEPPRLTCLEELDHGLHPHALDRIVERLRDASHKTQIIAATHSPALVNRLSVDELIVVERDADTGESLVFRPNPDVVGALAAEGLGLSEIWFSGVLGGAL